MCFYSWRIILPIKSVRIIKRREAPADGCLLRILRKIAELIELICQRKVLYDTKFREYKDQLIRNAAWKEIAETSNEPVNKCKDDWAKLRNAFASALKRRRNKKSGQAAATFVPWKHEESMGFLLPYMECSTRREGAQEQMLCPHPNHHLLLQMTLAEFFQQVQVLLAVIDLNPVRHVNRLFTNPNYKSCTI